MSLRLTVLGGGPGGYTAAFAAARLGMTVTLIEAASLGGTCLNQGCIPTKTLKASADALELALRLREFGIVQEGIPTVDMPAVMARKAKVCQTLRGGLEKTCAQAKVTLLRGRGVVLAPRTVQVTLANGDTQNIANDALIIATGSTVAALPGVPFDGLRILSSDHALTLVTVPQRLCIVGGGVVGCEMACMYSAFGSKVTVVEGTDRLLPMPGMDAQVGTLLQREMKKRGIMTHLARTLTDITAHADGVRAVLLPSPFVHPPLHTGTVPLEADAVLITVGRAPATAGLGLDAAGVATDTRGWIIADAYLRTSQAQVYAVGDVLGPQRVMLAHVAAAEALVAVQNILNTNNTPTAMEYSVVPSAIFTTPEIGCVGMSEAESLAQGHNVTCSVVQMRELGKAHAMNEIPGFVKLVIDVDTDRLLGAHIIGAHATELIAELTLALRMGATAADIARTIHAHPTLAEGVYEAALRKAE